MDVRYTYDAARNLEGRSLGGVPLADLTADDIDALPAHLQETIATTPYYVATRTQKAAAKDKETSNG